MTLAAGVALGIGAIYSHEQAEDAYESYILAKTVVGAKRFKARTNRFDRNSRFFLGTSIGALAITAALFFLDQEARVATTASTIETWSYMPLVRSKW